MGEILANWHFEQTRHLQMIRVRYAVRKTLRVYLGIFPNIEGCVCVFWSHTLCFLHMYYSMKLSKSKLSYLRSGLMWLIMYSWQRWWERLSTCLSCRWRRRWCWEWPWGCRRGWGWARSSWSHSTSSDGRILSITPDVILYVECQVWLFTAKPEHIFG